MKLKKFKPIYVYKDHLCGYYFTNNKKKELYCEICGESDIFMGVIGKNINKEKGRYKLLEMRNEIQDFIRCYDRLIIEDGDFNLDFKYGFLDLYFDNFALDEMKKDLIDIYVDDVKYKIETLTKLLRSYNVDKEIENKINALNEYVLRLEDDIEDKIMGDRF